MGFVPLVGTLFHDVQNVKKHGDFAYAWKQQNESSIKPRAFGGNLAHLVNIQLKDPVLIKEFLTNHEQYMKHPDFFGVMKAVLGQGLVTAEGSTWKKHRKAVSMAFHYELLKNMVPEVIAITNEMIGDLRQNPIEMSEINIMSFYQSITGEVVGRLFFGQKFSEHKIDGRRVTDFEAEFIAKIGAITLSLPNVVFGHKFVMKGYMKSHRDVINDANKLRALAQKMISERFRQIEEDEKNGKPNPKGNMLELFYDQKMTMPKDSLNDSEIIDEFLTFFMAGMDTTGHLITLASFYLLKNPQYREKMMEEVDKIFDQNVTIEGLNSMEFMTAFLKETLRMGTPAPIVFDRIADKDMKIGPYQFKKGTLINTSFLSNNFDKEYHDDPYTFDPCRWIGKSKTLETMASNPFAFSPFSIGGRNCIGQHLAMNEAKIILSLFLKKFDYELVNKNYKLAYNLRFLYQPDEEIKYALQPKS